MREVLSPLQAVNLAGSRGLWLGTVTERCQPVCSRALRKAAPSSSGHQHVLHQGHCRATAKPPLSHRRAIATGPWPARAGLLSPLSGPQIRTSVHVGRDALVGPGSLARDRWSVFPVLGLSPFCGAM